MPDPADLYSDQFSLHLAPFGCTINFSLSSAIPAAPGTVAQGTRLASIRMSLEHLKTMAYLFHRQIIEYERKAGVRVPVPQDVLNQLRVGKEDWDAFWRPVSDDH